MEIKNFNFLQSEAKHLQKLKKENEKKITNYESKIFPSTIEKYYQNKLSLIFIQSNDSNLNKKEKSKKEKYLNEKIELGRELLGIEKSKEFLGNYYRTISEFFLSLRKNQKLVLNILNNLKGDSKNIIINYISLLFYENALDIENNNLSEILNSNEIKINELLDILIEKELDYIIRNGNNYSIFLDGTVAGNIIKNFLKNKEVQNYLKNIFYEIIIDIIEMENKNVFMEPNRLLDFLNKKKQAQEPSNLKEKSKDIRIGKSFFKKIKKITSKDNMRKSMYPTSDKKNDIFNENNLMRKSVAPDFKSPNTFLNKKEQSINEEINNENNKNSNECLKYNSVEDIERELYKGLSHSRLIYKPQEQKIFFNEKENQEENICYDSYKEINIDEFLEIKEKNPEINNDYSKYELSETDLKNLYNHSIKKDKFMEEFYNNQIKELQIDSYKNFSNSKFIKSLNNKNYTSQLDEIILQYKKNFEKIKYFIDKMIYKMLQNKEDKIPFCIKNLINIINYYLKKKNKKISQIELNRYICEFFIGKIILPFLTNDEYINLIIGKKIDMESKTFLFYFAKIIKKIFRCNFYDSFESHFTIFNIYLCEILPYINSVILNFIPRNSNLKSEKKNINIDTNEKEINKIEYINKIVKYDSIIINGNIMIYILDYLIQKNNNSEQDIIFQKLLSSEQNLIDNFKLISDNYKEIIKQITENNDIVKSNDNTLNNNDNNNLSNNSHNNDNCFGDIFIILIKQEISKQRNKIISLSTKNIQLSEFEILPKIKYSLIKIFELIPYNFINKNPQLINHKNIIDFFSEIKKITNTTFISDFINEKNKIEKENQISLIWHVDFFLKFYDYLSKDYKEHDFKKLFIEIKNKIKNEIKILKNDISEYTFSLIIEKINEKINSMDKLFNYYRENIFLNKLNNLIFNLKIKKELFEYTKDTKKYIYFNKQTNKENKENKDLNFEKNVIIENVSQFIKYISSHIENENILYNFMEIEMFSNKSFSQINNINTLVNEFIDFINNFILDEINHQIFNNNSDNNEEKENIEINDIIEEIIHEGIYKEIWDNNMSVEDTELNEICRNKLAKITPDKIGINDKYINEHIWQNVLYLMKTKFDINNYKTPMKKIKCVENIYSILNQTINVITNKANPYSVDDIFPIFVYFLIKVKPEFLVSNLNFIKLLFNKKHLFKSSGFALTQLEMAIQYIQNFEIGE